MTKKAQEYDTPYQEEDTSTITHHGVKYPLNALFTFAHKLPVHMMDTEELLWILKEVKLDKERVKNADPTVPLLVARWVGRWVVIDGVHRLKKAHDSHIDDVPVKIIPATWFVPANSVDDE